MLKTTEVVGKDEKVVVSGKNEIIAEDWKKVAYNFVKFNLPTIALIFFGALQMGESLESAVKLSLVGLYGVIVDLLTKWKNEVKYVVEKETK